MPVLIAIQLATAFGANIPLGAWRRGFPKFSPWWFVAIHASIPALIAMRLLFGLPAWVIAPEIPLAVLGQVMGARLPNYLRESWRSDTDPQEL